ncbi:hypothetical protein Dda_1571 [Drechslerella dactyloides]|uniref:Arrestin-like N-terminal domain-containing protein n=1 Tax=Drechslerella dactyloides TaxID=74499 RepID=A0AAD6J213_DREDA|nr:hypothetical protein Dda_1571 [Drechslerella dactyloides]
MAPMELVLDPRPGNLPGTTSSLYTASDVVSGHARVSIPAESIKSLSIDFTGTLRVYIHNSSTGGNLQQASSLFNYSLQPIIPSPTGRYNFAFTIPPTIVVVPDLSRSSTFNANPPRHVPPAPQSLLPSFSYGKLSATDSSETGARIEYTLTAKLEYKSTIFTRRDTKVQTIHISSAPASPGSTRSLKQTMLPIEHTWALQTSRLKPGMEHHKPSAMERFSSFFANPTAGDPKLIVALRVDMPTSLTLGESVPSSLSLNFLPESVGIEGPPRIYITKLTATLRILTDFAVGTATKRKENTMELCNKCFPGRTQLLEYGYARKLDIGEWMSENFTLDAGNQLVPTFATPSLRRRYSIEIEVTVECVGETWKKKFESDLVLVPAVSSIAAMGGSPIENVEESIAGPSYAGPSNAGPSNFGQSPVMQSPSSPTSAGQSSNGRRTIGQRTSRQNSVAQNRPSEKGQPTNAVQLEDDYGPPPSYSEF